MKNIKNNKKLLNETKGKIRNSHIGKKHTNETIEKMRKSKLSNTVDFIKKSKKIHKNKYDYSKVKYKHCNLHIIIICREHGEFEQTPHNHLNGHGCFKCGFKKRIKNITSTKRNFINKAMKIHGNKYDYSEVKYINNYNKVKIKCPIHGIFLQTPNVHINYNSGCRKCNLKGLYTNKFFKEHTEQKNENGFLYLIHLYNNAEDFYKIGITKNIKHRFKYFKGYKKEKIVTKEMELYKAFLIEQHILKKFIKHSYIPSNKIGGKKECLSLNDNTLNKVKNIIYVNS